LNLKISKNQQVIAFQDDDEWLATVKFDSSLPEQYQWYLEFDEFASDPPPVILESNKRFIFFMYLPLALLVNILIFIMIIGFLLVHNNMSKYLMILYFFIFMVLCHIFSILIAKCYRGKSYIFDKRIIYVFNKGILKEKINISNIVTMHYYPFKIHYFLTIFGGALNEGGAMKIHIKENDGVYFGQIDQRYRFILTSMSV
jgi:hypothetical protein